MLGAKIFPIAPSLIQGESSSATYLLNEGERLLHHLSQSRHVLILDEFFRDEFGAHTDFTSVRVAQPGDQATFRRLHISAISSLRKGVTMKSAPICR